MALILAPTASLYHVESTRLQRAHPSLDSNVLHMFSSVSLNGGGLSGPPGERGMRAINENYSVKTSASELRDRLGGQGLPVILGRSVAREDDPGIDPARLAFPTSLFSFHAAILLLSDGCVQRGRVTVRRARHVAQRQAVQDVVFHRDRPPVPRPLRRHVPVRVVGIFLIIRRIVLADIRLVRELRLLQAVVAVIPSV